MSDCSSDVCSSDLTLDILGSFDGLRVSGLRITPVAGTLTFDIASGGIFNLGANNANNMDDPNVSTFNAQAPAQFRYVTQNSVVDVTPRTAIDPLNRSEEHTSELQSLMRTSYAVFCLKKQRNRQNRTTIY